MAGIWQCKLGHHHALPRHKMRNISSSGNDRDVRFFAALARKVLIKLFSQMACLNPHDIVVIWVKAFAVQALCTQSHAEGWLSSHPKALTCHVYENLSKLRCFGEILTH